MHSINPRLRKLFLHLYLLVLNLYQNFHMYMDDQRKNCSHLHENQLKLNHYHMQGHMALVPRIIRHNKGSLLFVWLGRSHE